MRKGDLVLDAEGRFGLVREALPGDRASVRWGDGTVTEASTAELARTWRGPGLAPANFAEEMRPDWADPFSPHYRPPRLDQED